MTTLSIPRVSHRSQLDSVLPDDVDIVYESQNAAISISIEPQIVCMHMFEGSDPVNRVDPMGLQATAPTTGPATAPTTLPALAHSGSGTSGEGVNKVSYSWSMQDTSGNAAVQKAMLSGGKSIFTVIKVKKADKGCPFTSFLWIQYSEARQVGKVYTPPGGKWPWVGIDRYPNNNRNEGQPYTFLPQEQAAIDQGQGYEGRVKTLYDNKDADSIFIDYASSGGNLNWEHFSIVTLIGQRDGKDYRLGSLVYDWSVDGKGNLTYGARAATDAEVKTWEDSLKAGYGKYSTNTYQGPAK